jgi:hypothetical protein
MSKKLFLDIREQEAHDSLDDYTETLAVLVLSQINNQVTTNNISSDEEGCV